MNTSQRTSILSKPIGDNRIPIGDIAYMRARTRRRFYDFVIKSFRKSEISQATLARRMGKGPEVVSRILGTPGNWTIDTVSDLVFALTGGETALSVHNHLDDAPRNFGPPAWLETPSIQNMAHITVPSSRSHKVTEDTLLVANASPPPSRLFHYVVGQ